MIEVCSAYRRNRSGFRKSCGNSGEPYSRPAWAAASFSVSSERARSHGALNVAAAEASAHVFTKRRRFIMICELEMSLMWKVNSRNGREPGSILCRLDPSSKAD